MIWSPLLDGKIVHCWQVCCAPCLPFRRANLPARCWTLTMRLDNLVWSTRRDRHNAYTFAACASFQPPLPAGPFLALSNHPGTVDTLALFSALNRSDLKIIAVDRPFLKSLTHVSQRLFYVTDDPGARMSLVRQVSGHLRSGGAILTFPAGKIEPDANVYPGAVEALQGWTDSVGIFVRMAPETAILPIVVRGVIWEKAAGHPLTRLKKTREDREKLAAAFQLLAHVVLNKKPLDVTVQIGKPITAAELGCQGYTSHPSGRAGRDEALDRASAGGCRSECAVSAPSPLPPISKAPREDSRPLPLGEG